MIMNIIEVAKLAGVSKSTVSRYLNDGYVSSENRFKIQEIIESTGYTPLRQAKTLRTKITNLIGVIVPKISTETASRVVEGISNEVSKYGYDILIANANLSVDKEIEYLEIFKNNQVDGIIFMATKLTEKHLRIMASIEFPMVVVAQKTENFHCVYYDDYNASKDMVKLLLNKGHTEIAFIGVTEEDISVGFERKRGYMDALKEYGVSCKQEFLKKGDFTMDSGYKLAAELMDQTEKPKAIFAVTDNIAIGAMQYLTEIGYKIPEDISICSIGDSKISRVVTPKLTTAHYFYKTAGEKSAEIMMELLNKNIDYVKENVKNIKLGYRLEVRNSIK
ncbi:LacI family DNA-binding transcriptional regulator [Clostridium sp. CM027]|nr:LacI family DNA-binding transcriptional regulator [Clostridium sp. CM027]UVE42641.1 LacI family DNA-binding transcriptional regulator [Clostridium sp. CM027]